MLAGFGYFLELSPSKGQGGKKSQILQLMIKIGQK